MQAPVSSLLLCYACLVLGVCTSVPLACAQWTPAATALALPDSLVFVGTPISNSGSVVFNPVCNRYYSMRIGNAIYPLETWLATGGASTYQTTMGVDIRGAWWNPNTLAVECNLFSSGGWHTVPVDGNCQANSTGAPYSIFSGLNQPTSQSVGTYDWNTNTVLFYNAGSLYVYDRASAALTATIALTGTSLTTVNTNTLIYTGQTGYEIGLLDYSAKRVLLFRRSDGVLTGMSQLPSTAVTGTQYRFSYANGRVWLFNPTPRKWNAYCIWQQTCPVVLPVKLLSFNSTCEHGRSVLHWSTASERNSSHFTVERSTDAVQWAVVGEVRAAGHSQQVISYTWSDMQAPAAAVVYYRLRQVDLDGSQEVFQVIAAEACAPDVVELQAWPNPTDGVVAVRMARTQVDEGPLTLVVKDMHGRTLQRSTSVAGTERILIDLSALAAGTYVLLGLDADGLIIGTTRVIRR